MIKSEVQLAGAVVQYFDHGEVYKEQHIGGYRCDIVVKTGPLIIAIECKMQFSTAVIFQALRNKPYCHYSYVAVPRPGGNKNNYEAESICKELGIGVIYVQDYKSFKQGQFLICGERAAPAYNRRPGKTYLDEAQKEAIAGAQHNSQSSFKMTIREIEDKVKEKGGIAIEMLFKQKFHWANPKSARQCFLSYVRNGILKQFTIEDGIIKFKLDGSGKEKDQKTTGVLFPTSQR